MQLSEFQILQLAASLASDTPSADDETRVARMFAVAEAIKREIEARQPKGRAEVDVI